jgi:hypothetical protein
VNELRRAQITGFQPRLHCDRSPKVSRETPLNTEKFLGHHTYDCERDITNDYSPADCGRISTETPLPKAVTNIGDRRSANFIVGFANCPTKHGLNPKTPEIITGNQFALGPTCLATDIDTAAAETSEGKGLGEDLVVQAHILEQG